MFVSRLNTYPARTRQGLTQRHVCSHSDRNAPHPATEQTMKKLGYRLEPMGSGLFSFAHAEKGYLVFHPDMSLEHHSQGLIEDCYVRQINPEILPPPPPPIKAASHIAKYIHQTGRDAELPENFRHNRDSLILLNPDYEYHYWPEHGQNTISDFIKTHYGPEMLAYYDSISPKYGAAKADLFRYLCIYRLGGVYLDLKSSVVVPLERIIHPDDTCLLSFWPRVSSEYPELQHIKYASEYEQFFIICAAGHPLMRRIIHQTLCNIKLYDPYIHGVGLKGTFLTTGPIMYSRIINSYRSPKTSRLFHSRSSGVEYSVFEHEEHYRKIGDTHYTQQDTPLILGNETL